MLFFVNCVQRTNIQNLKAIHNSTVPHTLPASLCSKNEYTKSESNSQLTRSRRNFMTDCVQRTNIQNLKAIHNKTLSIVWVRTLCSKNEYTKSESNSQPVGAGVCQGVYCVQRTNIQNLKAIHNRPLSGCGAACIVFKERIYKI